VICDCSAEHDVVTCEQRQEILHGIFCYFRTCVVVGAGYIAVELAGILQALGSKVTLIIRGTHVLRTFDPLIMEKVTENLEAAGVTVRKESVVKFL